MSTPRTIIVLSADGDGALSSRLCDADGEARRLVDYKERLLFARSMAPAFERLGLQVDVPFEMDAALTNATTDDVVTFIDDAESTTLVTLRTSAKERSLDVRKPYDLLIAARAH